MARRRLGATNSGDRLWQGGIQVREQAINHFYLSALPYRPLWPGFALDTAFYGTLVFLLWSTPGVVRRRIRKNRGRCPACGYDLTGLGTCPECGRS